MLSGPDSWKLKRSSWPVQHGVWPSELDNIVLVLTRVDHQLVNQWQAHADDKDLSAIEDRQIFCDPRTV